MSMKQWHYCKSYRVNLLQRNIIIQQVSVKWVKNRLVGVWDSVRTILPWFWIRLNATRVHGVDNYLKGVKLIMYKFMWTLLYGVVLYVWEIPMDLPHIQRRVNVTHVHGSDRLNVKCMKLIRGKFMWTLLCGFVRMCGRFSFSTTAHPEAGECHTHAWLW
jgi:hypothetical protein